MNSKQIAGIVVLVAGIGMLFASRYIKEQVESGKEQISSAQKKVDTGNSLFNMNPVTKQVGKGITSSAQNKINAGQEEVDRYEQMASWLQIGGIVAIVAGGASFFLFRKKR